VVLAAFVTAAMPLFTAPDDQSLPDLKSLPELKLELVLDLSDHPDAGLPWVGRISPRGEFVFYDARLHRIMIMPFDGRNARTVGSFGEGPGEYQNVLDIRLEENGLFILDSRGRIVEFGWEGSWRRDRRLPRSYEKILGRSGDSFYLVGRDISAESFSDRSVEKWREGEEAVPLLKMRADVLQTKASSLDGKAMAGGTFTLSEPALALMDDGFAASDGPDYRIRLFDSRGKARSAWGVKSPKPEFFGRMFGMYNGKRSAYAIRDIFPLSGAVAVVGNFFRDGKPRMDVFDRAGKRTSSWVIPLSCEAPFSRCQIEAGFLIHFSSDEGTRVFRIMSRL